jgi:CBS domain containing-hemolysin-like protein/mannitol/fructose-specific phosphotransferase system IIA component (Ntr-type)
MASLLELLIALIFLLLNAFFVLAEFALVKVRFTRLEELAAGGDPTAVLAKDAVQHMDGYLAAIQLGITMASLGLGWIGEPALARIMAPAFHSAGLAFSHAVSYSISFGIAFIVITALHVILGEQVPKYMAILTPEKTILRLIFPLRLFYRFTYYPMLAINTSSHYFLRLFRVKPGESELLHSDEELRIILGQSQEHGKLSLGRLMMFEHLFDFGKTGVTEVMTPQRSIAYISLARPWPENIAVIKEKKYSRYPLTATDLREADSFVHFKDLALDFLDRDGACYAPELQKLKRPLHFIPEGVTVEKALRDFQEKRIHFALVKNPQGEISGLLTMEDIVEELTGEIRDEFDPLPALTLSQALVGEAFVPDLKGHARPEAIRELLEKLRSIHPIFDVEETLKAIMKRETNFSTALGHQTAFPHARLPGLSRTMVAVGMRRDGIDFPSADNQPVRVMFLILTPFNEPTAQLHILARLSGLISNLTLRRRLFSARTPSHLLDIIRTFENKVMK